MTSGKIFIIDDEKSILQYLTEILIESGYEVRATMDGSRAVEMISAEAADLILLDVHMPDPNGFEVCRRLKANPETQDIPVLFLTGMSDFNLRIQGFQLGAVDYIVKPVHTQELKARVQAHVNLFRLRKDLSEHNLLLEEHIHEKELAERSLKEVLETLEERVEERTLSLQETNTRLEKEIAERGRITALLQESEERYRLLFHSIGDLIFLHSFYGKIPEQLIDVNEIVVKKLGYSREELLEMDLREVLVDIDQQGHWILSQLHEKGEVTFQIDLQTRSGQRIPHDVSSHLLYLGSEQVILSAARDISERIQAEQSLRTSEMRFQAFMKAAPLYVFYKDEAGRYLYCNPFYEDFYGMDPGDWQLKTDEELFERQIADSHRSGDQDVLDTGKKKIIRKPFHHRKGTFHGDAYKFPFEDAAGKKYIGAIAFDTTERQLAEEQLKKSRDQAELLYKAGQVFSSRLEIGQILADLHDFLVQVISFDMMLFFRLVEDSQTLECISFSLDSEFHAIKAEERKGLTIPLRWFSGQGGSGERESVITRSGELEELLPDILDALQRTTPALKDRLADPKTKFSLTLPLQMRDTTTGIVQIVLNQEQAPDPDLLRVVQTLTNEAAIAMNNAALYQTAQEEIAVRKQSEDKLRSWNAELAVLNRISSLINQSQDRAAMLDSVLMEVTGLIEADASWLLLFENLEEIRLFQKDTHGGTSPITGMTGSRIHEYLAEIAGVNQVTALYRGEKAFSAGLEKGLFTQDTNIFLLVPIFSKEVRVGVIGLCLFLQQDLEPHWQTTLLNVGQLLGTVLENVQLLRNNAEMHMFKEMEDLRSELIANVSHEMRTPIGLIKATSTAMLMEDINIDQPLQQELLQDISEECDRLEQIVSSLLMVSRIHNQKIYLDIHNVDLASILRKQLDDIRTQYGDHSFISTVPDIPILIEGDGLHLAQVIRNLLSNAAKYSPKGKPVTVALTREQDHVYLQVIDQGIGIPTEEKEKIFQRFYRVKNSFTRQVSGVGLGLSICKGIVEAHSGRIWVESTVGEGSSFHVLLPCMHERSGDQVLTG